MQLVAKASIKLKDVTDLEVVVVLSKLGLSQADILGLVIGSALMLCLIFIFLFLGMGLFIEGAASDGQAVINSLITAGSALAFNANASAGGGTKLKELLNKAMEYVRKMQGVGEFSFDVNEDCAGMLNRASDFQKKKEQGALEGAKSKHRTPKGSHATDTSREEEPAEKDSEKDEDEGVEKRKRRKGATRVQAAGPSFVFCNERMKPRKNGGGQWRQKLEISTETSTGESVKMIVENGHMSKPFVHCTPGQVFEVYELRADQRDLIKTVEVPDNHTGCKVSAMWICCASISIAVRTKSCRKVTARSCHWRAPLLLTYDCTLQFVQVLDSDSDDGASSDLSGYEYKPGYNVLDSSDEEDSYYAPMYI
jgi:hypothetical protein